MRYLPNSPDTIYLTGELLGEFIQEYCDRQGIYCDECIFNLAFGNQTVFSENAASALIEETATRWRLRGLQSNLETLQ